MLVKNWSKWDICRGAELFLSFEDYNLEPVS